MHQPVHPVKISIVHQRHDRESDDEIKCSVQADICIEFCVSSHFRATQYQERDKGHNEYGQDGKNDLPGIIPERRETLLDLF